MTTWDLLVAGGGIVGASAAYHAARAGARVLVIDRGDIGRATPAGAGIVSPETDIQQSASYLELGRLAADYYPTLLDALPRRAGYRRCGMLVVALDEEESREFDAFATTALERQRSRGDLAPDDALRAIEPAEAQALFPPLGGVRRALWNPRGARVDGREVTAAMLEAACACGAQQRTGGVEAILHAGGEASPLEGLVVDGERLAAPAAIVAGGAWTPALLASLGIRVPIDPQRGQIAHLVLEGADSGAWPMVAGFRDHYLVAWPGGRLVAGATRETGSGFDARTTAAGVREVLTEALRLAPGLAPAALLEIRVGLRPVSIDGLPILGPVRGRAGLWLASGHGPAGLTLGPYCGKVVAEAALGGAWSPELDAFSIDRFAETERSLRK